MIGSWIIVEDLQVVYQVDLWLSSLFLCYTCRYAWEWSEKVIWMTRFAIGAQRLSLFIERNENKSVCHPVNNPWNYSAIISSAQPSIDWDKVFKLMSSTVSSVDGRFHGPSSCCWSGIVALLLSAFVTGSVLFVTGCLLFVRSYWQASVIYYNDNIWCCFFQMRNIHYAFTNDFLIGW